MKDRILLEQELISHLITDKKSLIELIPNIKEEYFSSVTTRIFFQAIRNIYIEYNDVEITSTLLSSALSKIGKSTKDIHSIYNKFIDINKTATNPNVIIKILKDSLKRDNTIDLVKKYSNMIEDETYDISDTITNFSSEMFNLTLEQEDSKIANIGESADVVFEQLYKIKNDGIDSVYIPTGFNAIDEKVIGFQRGDLVVIGARPSQGKTAITVQMLDHMASNNHSVLFFSLEMKSSQILQRMWSYRTGIPFKNIREGSFSDEEGNRIIDENNHIKQLPLIVSENALVDINYVRNISKKIKERDGKLDVIAIDYLQLMDSTPEYINSPTHEKIKEITRKAKLMANELNCVVILLSQLNRKVEERPDKRPQMSDLMESSTIEANADYIFFLYRDSYYNKESSAGNIAEIILAKARQASVGTIYLNFFGYLTKFQDITDGLNAISVTEDESNED